MLQEGDGDCLKLFLAYFLHGRQWSGHIMYGRNISFFSSVRVLAVGVICWVTFSAGPTDLDNGRARAYCACAGGVVRIFLFSPIISLFFLPPANMDDLDFTSFFNRFQSY